MLARQYSDESIKLSKLFRNFKARMSTNQRLLETFLIRQKDHEHKRIYGQSLTAKAKNKFLKNFKISLSDKDVYTHYEIKNGTLLNFVQAKLVNHSFEEKFVYVAPLFLEQKKGFQVNCNK